MVIAALSDYMSLGCTCELLSYHANEFDLCAGTSGLHSLRKKIAARERTSVMPPDVFRRFESDALWLDPAPNPHRVRMV